MLVHFFVKVIPLGMKKILVRLKKQWGSAFSPPPPHSFPPSSTTSSAGNNTQSPDIVRPNFKNVRPSPHHDRKRWPNISPAHLELSSSRCCQSIIMSGLICKMADQRGDLKGHFSSDWRKFISSTDFYDYQAQKVILNRQCKTLPLSPPVCLFWVQLHQYNKGWSSILKVCLMCQC